ncbi:MAG: tRNA (guanosine(46)-N7)-methyltransferase TrmB [Sciscionella sp.]
MTVGQQRAWERWWPALGRDVAELPDGPLDAAAWFGHAAPLLLEIGSGMGEGTAAMAAAQPEVNYLAVEVHEPGLAQLIMRARALGAANLRLLRGDAIPLLAEHIPAGALAGARIFFPDPWPKKRHHKRRLIQPGFVSLLASRIARGGTLHLATDMADYAEQMAQVCAAEPLLRNSHGGWAPRPDWRPVTKFEHRADVQGRTSRDLIFERVGG